MPFCTIVEFDWDQAFGPDDFASAMAAADDRDPSPDGRLSLIRGTDQVTGRVIEVWRSGADAQAFAERSAPFVASMPPPSRVMAFPVTSYVVS